MADDNGFVGIVLFGARSQMTANRLQDKVKYYGLRLHPNNSTDANIDPIINHNRKVADDRRRKHACVNNPLFFHFTTDQVLACPL